MWGMCENVQHNLHCIYIIVLCLQESREHFEMLQTSKTVACNLQRLTNIFA